MFNMYSCTYSYNVRKVLIFKLLPPFFYLNATNTNSSYMFVGTPCYCSNHKVSYDNNSLSCSVTTINLVKLVKLHLKYSQHSTVSFLSGTLMHTFYSLLLTSYSYMLFKALPQISFLHASYYLQMHLHMYTFMYVYTQLYTYKCMHTVCIYTRMHVHTSLLNNLFPHSKASDP